MTRPSPSGILLAAFGAGTESGKAALLGFANRVAKAYPGHAPRWAFTTERPDLRPALADEPGLPIGEALSRLAKENTPRIALQPLHLTEGHEYDALCRQVAAWRREHPEISVSVGAPLLTDAPSMRAALDAMRQTGVLHAAPGEAVIWVGHGSEPGQSSFSRLGQDDAYRALSAMGETERPPVRMGWLTHPDAAEENIRALRASGVTKACLMPFFALAGNHTLRDIDGSAPTSWKSRFTAAGIACRVHLQGLVEHDVFAEAWLARLGQALRSL